VQTSGAVCAEVGVAWNKRSEVGGVDDLVRNGEINERKGVDTWIRCVRGKGWRGLGDCDMFSECYMDMIKREFLRGIGINWPFGLTTLPLKEMVIGVSDFGVKPEGV